MCVQFLRECRPVGVADNICQFVAMADYSRLSLQALRAETGIVYDCLMRELGCPRDSIGPDDAIKLEPALAGMRGKIVGGDFTASDESGDVYQFTSRLAALAGAAGVDFRLNATVTRLLTECSGGARCGKIAGVEVRAGPRPV
jgi:D-amino-acid dehydrogenase